MSRVAIYSIDFLPIDKYVMRDWGGLERVPTEDLILRLVSVNAEMIYLFWIQSEGGHTLRTGLARLSLRDRLCFLSF